MGWIIGPIMARDVLFFMFGVVTVAVTYMCAEYYFSKIRQEWTPK